LYSWDELQADECNLELRVVESNIGIQPNQYTFYSQPKDAVDFAENNIHDIDSIPAIVEKVSLL
jgi:hypothetical protein